MTDTERAQIERINEISAIARTSWLALLGYLAFIGISLLAVEDADFFVPTRRTDLPLVGVAIPTYAFFLFAPMLAAALYIYLHIHLLKLWDAIADAPARMDGAPLGEKLHPWIANDYALALKGNGALRPRPLRWLGNLATRLLVWLAGPAVIAGFWWRSMPAHDEGLTFAIAAALLVATHAGLTSWWTARAHLSTPWLHGSPWRGWRIDAGIGVALAVVAVSWLRTEGGLEHYANKAVNLWERAQGNVRMFASFEEQEARIDATRWVPKLDWFTLTGKHWLAGIWLDVDETWNPLARTNLEGVYMVALPEAWRTPGTARSAFRKTWCEREGLNMAVCDHVPSADRPAPVTLSAERAHWCGERQGADQDACLAQLADLDRRFEIAWLEERGAALDNLPKLDLADRDLRNALGSGAALIGADLRRARLEGAHLGSARLEGADLTLARLEGADLHLARLERVDLTLAGLERANLWQARLDGANLTWARVDWANLSWAWLNGANLTWAQLWGADLSQARLEGADLRYADFRNSRWNGAAIRAAPAHFADFRGVYDLTQAQLEDLIGNSETLLPDAPAPDTGEPFYLWSCWDNPPHDIDRIIVTAAPFGDDSERAGLRAQFLCSSGSPRSKTGTRLPLNAPYPDGHPLAKRD